MTSRYSTDIVIFGGGIAGLWLLNRLKKQGYDCILLDTSPLGARQTLNSQGIIHGGLKYALSGNISKATEAIASMPQRWRQLLAGEGELELRDVRVLSDHYYMWSSGGIRAKLKTFLGSKSLRGRVESLDKAQYPEFFQNAREGLLYRLPDFVIDSQSLLTSLLAQSDNAAYQLQNSDIRFDHNARGQVSACEVHGHNGSVKISAQRFIFTAGKGNDALLAAAACTESEGQLRPLKMVCVTGSQLPEVFVHCIGSDFSLTPRLTVTSHRHGNNQDAQMTWYLGGELAESGVHKSDAEQIQAARDELAEIFPWVDTSESKWQCLDIDRAEASNRNSKRPDDAFFHAEKHTIVAWPTKFTLTPSLADRLVDHLEQEAVRPGSHPGQEPLSDVLQAAALGKPFWLQGDMP